MSKISMPILVMLGAVVVLFALRFIGSDTSKSDETKEISEFDTWVAFTPDNKTFTALFPRPPAHITQEDYGPFGRQLKKFEIYAADGLDEKAYVVEVISFPKGPSPETDDQVLKNTLKDIISHSTLNQLESSKEYNFKEQKALAFVIDNGERKIDGIIFVWNKALYVLTRLTPERFASDKSDYDFFIQSFKLPEKENES